MKKILIIVLFCFVILVLILLFLNLFNTTQKPIKLSQEENIKDCGTEIDKAGAEHTINRDCFVNAFKACTPAKVYQESFPPDNVPSVKTTVQIEGKMDKGCRIQVNVHNTLAIPENNIYYCYKAEKTTVDDTSNIKYLLINECDNGKRLVY